jgi:hypothetical protein
MSTPSPTLQPPLATGVPSPPLPADAPPGFHLLAKPSGSTCNIDCTYCFFLSKESLYPNDRHRMSQATLEAYIRQLLESHRTPQVTVAWQGGEPTLMKLDFFRRAVELVEQFRQPGQTVQHTFQTWDVRFVDRQQWQKPGKTPTLRVEYHGGLNQRVSQWLCFDHEPTSYANVKARQWWVQHGGRLPHPLCVEEALARWGELNDFTSVTVKVGGEYPELKAVVSERQVGSDDDRLPRAVADDVDYSEIPF